MATIEAFSTRIDADFNAAKQRVAKAQASAAEGLDAQRQRYQLFQQARERVREEIARPRLEKLAKMFPQAQSKLDQTADAGTVTLTFAKAPDCPASVTLKLSQAHDMDIRNLLLTYDLQILPVFIKFDSHAQLEMPLDKVDYEAAANWLDEHLVTFVQTYLSIQFVEQYQQDNLVADPVSRTRFPPNVAKSTLEHGGKKYYFMCDQTRQDFDRNPSQYA